MKNVGSKVVVLTLLAGWVAASGCSVLQPQRDPSRFFTLAALPEAQVHRDMPREGEATPHGRLYGLGPIKLPPYLDRNEIATRLSTTELTYADTDRWAEPLQVNVTRVLLQNLSALLGTDRVADFPWPADLKIDYQIEVDLLQFERLSDATSRLIARWRIKDARKGAYRMIKESQLTRPSTTGTNESVAALSAMLGDLSQEIASALDQLAARE